MSAFAFIDYRDATDWPPPKEAGGERARYAVVLYSASAIYPSACRWIVPGTWDDRPVLPVQA